MGFNLDTGGDSGYILDSGAFISVGGRWCWVILECDEWWWFILGSGEWWVAYFGWRWVVVGLFWVEVGGGWFILGGGGCWWVYFG